MGILSAGGARALPLAVITALGALGCLVDRSAAPRPSVALAIRGRIIGALPAALGDPTIRIHVFYTRKDGEPVALSSAPAEINVLRGTTTVQPVTVDVGACIRDATREPLDGPGCFLGISLALVGDDGLVVDSATSLLGGAVSPGGATQTPLILLTTPDSVRLLAQTFRGSVNSPPVVLSAIVYDANGSLPDRHPLQWTSTAPQVLGVTSLEGDSAEVSFLSIGNAFVRVTAGTASDSVGVSVFGTDTITARPLSVTARAGHR